VCHSADLWNSFPDYPYLTLNGFQAFKSTSPKRRFAVIFESSAVIGRYLDAQRDVVVRFYVVDPVPNGGGVMIFFIAEPINSDTSIFTVSLAVAILHRKYQTQDRNMIRKGPKDIRTRDVQIQPTQPYIAARLAARRIAPRLPLPLSWLSFNTSLSST
jgi:hypothetical protein